MCFKNLLIVAFTILMISCEKEIDVKLPSPKDQIVVEGYIENDVPPYVFLTKNSAYFGDFDVNDLDKYFVKGAKIIVSSDSDSIELVEYSSELINFLPDEEKMALAQFFGLPLDSNFNIPKISVYTVPLESSFVGEIGKNYQLRIEVDNKILTATTNIPNPVGFSKLWTEPHPSSQYDSLVQLKGLIRDPDTLGNFYRYFTRRNSEAFTKNYPSVLDDLMGNGKEFETQVPLGYNRFSDEEIDFNTFGFWNKKDTCYVKLAMISRTHYDFWRTLENELSNQGSPFGSYTRIRSNIKGGLGIWGGYGSVTSVYYPIE
ncbi:MAG: DUF4249 domain-containing protein [Chitinophagales bacterium]|nr:DUF4249 domain-containing protein [Chitinophagales bacterium]MCZ2392258.1 DUF4249 domain-containing protein [Chitinophagales bacterium]